MSSTIILIVAGAFASVILALPFYQAHRRAVRLQRTYRRRRDDELRRVAEFEESQNDRSAPAKMNP